jgi:hypothetical protein
MAASVTNQSFNETPNTVLTVFTTDPKYFTIGSLWITQGGLVSWNFSYIDNHTIEFDEAPDPNNGELRWAGQLAFGDDSEPSQFPDYTLTGPWTVDSFLLWYRYEPEQFAPFVTFVNWQDFENFIGNLLQQAEEKLQRYLRPSDDFYDRGTAEPVASGDEDIALSVKEAIALRTCQIIRDRYGVAGHLVSAQNVKEQSVTFEGAGEVALTYRNPITDELAAQNLINLSENQLFDALFVPLLNLSGKFGSVLSLADLPSQVESARYWNIPYPPLGSIDTREL